MKSLRTCWHKPARHRMLQPRRSMPWNFIALMAVVLLLTMQGYAQKVSLSVNNRPLEEVIQSIKQQTGYNFLYTAEMLEKAQKVTLHVEQSPLTEVLKLCFTNQSLSYTIEDKTIVVKEAKKLSVAKEAFIISGKVTDDKGEGLAGVTIKLKGQKPETITDALGSFTLRVPDNGTLVFTYIGYQTQELPVNSTTTVMAVTLKTAESNLNEVVVVGYGAQKKLTVTGAVSSITTKELRQSPTANVTNALAGRLPGLIATQFGGGEPGLDGSNIYIRGVSTYNDNSQGPIVIVDGLERPFNYLNPEEIESLSILKDASATAVFGIRGANGVIVVTTKRGQAKQSVDVNFKAQAGMADAVKYPKYLGSYEYAQLYNEAMLNDNPLTAPSSLFSAEQIENFRTAKGDNSDGKGYNINYYDYTFKPTTQQDYTLSINGGSNTARYFVLASYLNQDNNYRHVNLDDLKVKDGFRKYNFRSNVDVNINKNFSVRLDLSARVQNRITPSSSGGNPAEFLVNLVNTLPPMYPVTIDPNDNAGNAQFFSDHDGQLLFGTPTYRNNILGELSKTGYINEYSTYLEGTFRLAHKLDFITKGLRAEGFIAYDSYAGNRIDRNLSTTTEGSRIFPGYSTFSPATGPIEYWNGGSTNYQGLYVPTRSAIDGTIKNDINTSLPSPPSRRITAQLTANYDRSFGGNNVSGLLLAQRSLQTRNNDVPYARQGLAARGTWNWKQKYLAEINVAYNGSENFAPGFRYGFFPAVSAGWAISEENFMKNIDAISYLKIRGSFGLAGSDQMPGSTPRFMYTQLYVNGVGGYSFGNNFANTAVAGINEGTLANPEITWEKSREANIGLDLELFKGKLGLTVDVFRKYRYDIITAAYNGPSNGYTEIIGQFVPPLNLGRMVNKGIDMEFRFRDKIGNWSYYVRPNFTFTKNKVLFMNEVPRQYDWMRREGKPLNTNFVYVVDGFFNSQAEIDDTHRPQQQWGKLIPGDVRYRDIDGNGVIQQDYDQVPMGRPRVPEIQYGIPLGVSWKNFDLSMLFQGAARTSILLNGAAVYAFPSFDFDKLGGVKPMHLDRWTPTNTNASYPALHIGNHPNTQQSSSLFLYDASYIRLKTIEVGYNLSKKVIERAKIKSARFYAQALNLLTWDKLGNVDIDPETRNGNGAWYPIQKIINVGVQISL
jgi:TonB-linked SusC/RagA family outer membrane protein